MVFGEGLKAMVEQNKVQYIHQEVKNALVAVLQKNQNNNNNKKSKKEEKDALCDS